MKVKDEEKETRIKQVTLQIVSENGIAGVKMATVAKLAGLSPSTLYVYYSSKDELLKAIFRDTMQQMVDSDLGKSSKDLPYKAQVEKLYRRILSFKQHKAQEHHFIKQFSHSPYYNEKIKNEMRDIGEGFVSFLQHGREQMILKDNVDVFVIVALMDGVTDKLIEYSSKGKLTMSEQTLKDAFTLIWDGVKA